VSPALTILISVLLLAGNAFFVGAEFALISARRSAIEPLARAGHKAAKRTLAAMEQVSMMLAGAQLGITVCSLGLGALAEPALEHALEPVAAAIGLPDALVVPVSFVLGLSIVVYLHMVLGEMVPKNIALAGPERSALALAPPLRAIVLVLKPAIWCLNTFANIGLRILRVTPKEEITSSFTSEEVASMIAESRREGLLHAHEHRLLQRAITITQKEARNLLLPLAELVSVRTDATPREVEQLTAETGFSRFPVLNEDGGLVGYLHVKDTLLPADSPRLDLPLDPRLIRPLPVISETEKVTDVVAELQREGSHLGRVVSAPSVDGGEVGGQTLGLVALEDAVEELIGEVRDGAHP
jgi:CBS domain containing-hemolysin-like protein